MSWLGGQKDASKGRSGIVTVLDVGSTLRVGNVSFVHEVRTRAEV